MMTIDSNITPRVLVCQHGARRRYAVPRIIDQLGYLTALYTDTSSNSWLGLLALGIQNQFGIAYFYNKIRNRDLRWADPGKIRSSDYLLMKRILCIQGRPPSMSLAMKCWGTQNANLVYSMYGNDIDFLQYVKKKGLLILVDIFSSPLTHDIVNLEKKRLFGSIDAKEEKRRHFLNNYSKRVIELADILLVPSQWVYEGVVSICKEAESKLRIVPYGSSLKKSTSINLNPKQYILFVGRDVIRKGLVYLAEAAKWMHKQYPDWEVRVAGIHKEECISLPNHQYLKFLGKVPMDEMKNVFQNAYALVLPSLSEGQAGSVLEAMAMGCPLIITRECGVDPELDCGEIVISRDSKSLFEGIARMIENPNRRMSCATNCLQEASQYTTYSWTERIKNLLEEIISVPHEK
jgi:glycosyltransferase involved in cell wall biosynthesis